MFLVIIINTAVASYSDTGKNENMSTFITLNDLF